MTNEQRSKTDPRKLADWREFGENEIEEAHEFYLEYGPSSGGTIRILRAMHKAGWLHFRRADLEGTLRYAGLVKMFGWRAEWDALAETRKREKMARVRAEYLAEKEAAAAAAREAELKALSNGSSAAPGGPPPEFRAWLAGSHPDWKWTSRYQRHLCRALSGVTSGSVRRLMVFMPPRHGKSEMVTIRYAAWRLLADPSLRIVIGSYNQRLANKFSRRIRAEYRRWHGGESDKTADESQLVTRAVDEWETAAGGGVKAVGVEAGITGFGADLVIIDDPIKSRAEAESKNNRDRIWEWYTDDLMTRLEANGACILIQTRWHQDDLAGRLLAKQATPVPSDELRVTRGKNKEKWSVISLPAIAEDDDPLGRKPGQALWSERFPIKKLLEKKEEMGSYSFAALYQQRPAPAEGALFKRQWFTHIVERAPEGLRWFRGYDLAVSTKTSADFTASFRVALDKRTGDLYIADGFRGRIEFPEQRRYIVERIRSEPDTEHGVEEALHGQAFIQELMRDERLASRAFRGLRVTVDKYTRALAWANRAEAGRVRLVRGPWIDTFLDEITHFPNSAHDDQVDAVSLAVQMMETRKYRAMGF